ncbi:hypothetical protein LTR78_009068 [Recurvomyces mirabilis]|uniref:Uncharacterized protein n=1 Tax=Recurvomyces mirabilis TaxID=574656 RepID=A0AAE0WHJ0_9PEZI|nr:hypothetical protein LTR78_009068 [Recurvomyces mirabilis]KAK5150403.1 hypothetical protein LTS14_010093 [Recurvomyces mirabilis]
MATLAPNYNFQPRSSTETDRRYLLADSVAPSESASIITDFADDGGDRTPRAHSPAPSTAQNAIDQRFRIAANNNNSHNPLERRDTIADPTVVPQQPYKGFPSEAHYLAALHAWAEDKKFVQVGDTTLHGFYGHTSMQEYAARPGQDFGIKKKWRARKEAKQAKKEEKMSDAERTRIAGSRRNTVT